MTLKRAFLFSGDILMRRFVYDNKLAQITFLDTLEVIVLNDSSKVIFELALDGKSIGREKH